MEVNWEKMQVSKFEANDESVQVSNQVPSETELGEYASI